MWGFQQILWFNITPGNLYSYTVSTLSTTRTWSVRCLFVSSITLAAPAAPAKLGELGHPPPSQITNPNATRWQYGHFFYCSIHQNYYNTSAGVGSWQFLISPSASRVTSSQAKQSYLFSFLAELLWLNKSKAALKLWGFHRNKPVERRTAIKGHTHQNQLQKHNSRCLSREYKGNLGCIFDHVCSLLLHFYISLKIQNWKSRQLNPGRIKVNVQHCSL